ncbi:MAG: hypothetical protein ACPGJL_03415 [Acholeplasmataceae bacterium]
MKILLYVSTLGLVILTVLIVHSTKEDTFLIIRSIYTYYQVSDGDHVNVQLYASQKSEQLLETSIDRLQLTNDIIRIDVSYVDMTQEKQETYLKHTYYVYSLIFKLPKLFQTQTLEHVSLKMTLDQDMIHDIVLGHFFITPFESNFSHDWTSIYGTRHDTFMTLTSIIIETSDIIEVSLLGNINATTTYEDAYIEIIIHKNDAIILSPILLIRSVEGEEMISGMTFIQSNRMLNQTEGYHYVYALY